jgi:hypothetical protein
MTIPPDVRKWLMVAGATLVAVVALYNLVSGMSQVGSTTKVKYSKGCLIEVEAVDISAAGEVMEKVEFDDCRAGQVERSIKEPLVEIEDDHIP